MKKANYLVLGLTAFMLLLSSCGKDGATGPTGSTGPQGVAGPVGPAGANGSVIYSGNSAPATVTGANGDFYLDLSSGVLYGPKTSSGWGTGFSLKGPTGSAGAAGSQMLSGTTTPSTTLGANGDFYLDKSNYLLYGPKTSAGWGTAVNLKGPAGSANVLYTDWFTPPTYKKDTVFGIWGLYYDEAMPAITQSIIDQGTVITYGALNGYTTTIWPTNQVSQLPITITYIEGANTYIDKFEAFITPGNVRIQFTDDLNLYNSISNAHKFRCIIIPGGHAAALHFPHLDLNNYEAVRRYFRINN